ncbi:MAG: hypothetical protein M1820_001682 [Bogoriella megaspora]|nr:MAG: hypothetical protein M1820_001682 [Bogoriella megaspora]
MSIPPQIIRLKRKRGAEPPPDELVFAPDSKRPIREYAFRLLRDHVVPNPEAIEPRPSKAAVEQETSLSSPVRNDSVSRVQDPSQIEDGSSEFETGAPDEIQYSSKIVPKPAGGLDSQPHIANRPLRRFHLSKHEKDTIPRDFLRRTPNQSKVLKRSQLNAPVFSERILQQTPFVGRVGKDAASTNSSSLGVQASTAPDQMDTENGPTRSQTLSQADHAGASQQPIDPLVMQIFADMQKDYERDFHRDATSDADLRHAKSKLKPKVTARRYHERHPQTTKLLAENDLMDIDSGNDSDFVFDTYIRHRLDPLSSAVEDGTKHLGILVIDEDDQEAWEEFIDDGEDSEKDWNSEDEDSNAEDYYGADYPEDEVDLDDEFDEGAYKFRNNDSDEEAYDFDTGAWSDVDRMRHPWQKTRPKHSESTDVDSEN